MRIVYASLICVNFCFLLPAAAFSAGELPRTEMFEPLDMKRTKTPQEHRIRMVRHIVLEDETAWFLAELYYGKGSDYKKILKENGFSRPNEVVVGQVLKIKYPNYDPEDVAFNERIKILKKKRLQALGAKNRLDLGVAKIRKKDSQKAEK